ncbi:AIPR protein [uncultured Clostridium sp.]|nr:AIPR protein [uncultured Clostridium sp.]SCJ06403.1 AIPR protein [uncultured Clostridium sp.]
MNKDKIISIIKDVINENYIILQDSKKIDMKIERKLQNNQPITNEIDNGWKCTQEYFMFYSINCESGRINTKKILESILDELSESAINKENEYKHFNLYIIFNRLEDKLLFDRDQKECKFKKIILDEVKSEDEALECLHLRDIDLKTIFIGTSNSEVFNIQIDDRIRSLESYRKKYLDEEKNSGLDIKGFVFNAKLKDIVAVYNLLGNELFDKNLRYSIKDELDVDSHIRNTLKTSPDEFWYLNNGITMIIEDDDFKLRKSNSIKVQYGNDKILSVINGAQTISASAAYYYEKENEKVELSKFSEVDSNVILRIIHIKKFGAKKKNEYRLNKLCNTEINKISIALNRQKPIKQEDIAYTTSFVDAINNIKYNQSCEKYSFNIAKRSIEIKEGYDLLEFAKLVKSYLVQQPGKALTQGAKTLLALKDGELSDTDVFKEELIDGTKMINVFNKYYKPVNFAAKLMNFYSEQSKSKVKSGINNEKDYMKLKSSIASYGKLYFVAYIIYVLNGKNNEDFSEFNVRSIEEDFKLYVDKFIDLLAKFIVEKNENKINEVNINDFKNENLYNDFKDYEIKNEDNKLSKEINEFHRKLYDYFSISKFEESISTN